jgi:fermentation-respiration switch protein FrsA (DUF1100 family)
MASASIALPSCFERCHDDLAMRLNASTLMTVLGGLVVLKLLVLWLEPKVAFYPIRGVQETPADAGLPFVDVRIPTDDGETLHGWWLEDPRARAQVVFFHGNGGNLSLWLDVVADMRRRGLSVLAIDYRGYGESSGRPSEQGVYRDAAASIRLFGERLQKREIPLIFWGRSLGSPVAAYAASRVAPDGLVLETPMPHARALLAANPIAWLLSFLSSYSFSTSRLVAPLKVPLLIVHGDADSLVPYEAGKRVYAAAGTDRKTFVTIAGAGHNDLHATNPSMYWNAIDTFLTALRPARAARTGER